MAAMSDADKNRAARILGKRIFVDANANATMTHTELVAAVSAIDGAMEGTPAQLPNQTQNITNNLNIALPEPFKTTAQVDQKSALLAVWAGVKYGLL